MGGLMCDGGWGLVCPEAQKAAAAYGRKTQKEEKEDKAAVHSAYWPLYTLMKTQGDHAELNDTQRFSKSHEITHKSRHCNEDTCPQILSCISPSISDNYHCLWKTTQTFI